MVRSALLIRGLYWGKCQIKLETHLDLGLLLLQLVDLLLHRDAIGGGGFLLLAFQVLGVFLLHALVQLFLELLGVDLVLDLGLARLLLLGVDVLNQVSLILHYLSAYQLEHPRCDRHSCRQ